MSDFISWFRTAADVDSAAVRLLCFPHAGAGASSFNGWSRHLSQQIQVVKAQLPGREDNTKLPPFTRVDLLIAALMPHVLPLWDRPVAIYGHSMGALVAFELVRAIRRRGLRLPVAFIVSGRRAPHKPLRHPFLHSMADTDLISHLEQMGGTTLALLAKPKWRNRFLPTMRSDLELSDLYEYGPEAPLACPVYAFLGSNDREMYREDWEAWSEQAGGHFERHLLPGGHIFSLEVQAQLAAKIGEIVTRQLPVPDIGMRGGVEVFS